MQKGPNTRVQIRKNALLPINLAKAPAKRSLLVKTCPWVILGLDRPYLQRARTMRSISPRGTRFKNSGGVNRFLRYIDAAGRRVLRSYLQRAALRLPPLRRQKFRLKLYSAVNLHADAVRPVFKYRAMQALKRCRRAAATAPRKTQGATFLRFNSRTWRRALLLRRLVSPRPPVRIYMRRRKRWEPKLGAEHIPPAVVPLPMQVADRLGAFRYRLTRINAKGVLVRKFYRWWHRKKPIRSRRRYGKRLFSGVFGRRRWRLERRDKFILRRERRRYPLQRKVFYRVAQANFSLHVARWALRHTAHAAKVSHHARRHYAPRNVSGLYLPRPTSDLPVSKDTLPSKVAAPAKKVRRKRIRKVRFDRRLKWFDIKARQAQLFRSLSITGSTRPPLLARTAVLPPYRYAPVTAEVAALKRSSTPNTTVSASALPLVDVSKVWRSRLNPRLNRWGVARAGRKLTAQRRLRAATFSLGKMPTRRLTSCRGVRRTAVSAKLYRNALFGSTPLLYGVNSAVPRTALPVTPTTIARVLSARWPRKNVFHKSSFLEKGAKYTSYGAPLPVTAGLHAASTTLQQHRRYKELRFYHRRPRIRLPGNVVTRARRRKGGFVTFARNSLKRPHTLRGRENLLLPPATTYSGLTSTHTFRKSVALDALSAAEQYEDVWPQFWKRPHNRANIKAINRVRRRQYAKHKRSYCLRVKKQIRQRRISLLTHPHNLVLHARATGRGNAARPTASQVAAKLSVLRAVFARVKQPTTKDVSPATARVQFTSRLRKRACKRMLVARPIVADARRTTQHLSPTFSRAIEWNTLLPQARATMTQKMHGLWQVRSVQNMLVTERNLSAWSPQLSVRNRRAHSPRVGGVPRPRRWLGFTAKRERRGHNAKLLARNIPQRRYTDYTPIKLQYYYGSVSSGGYARFRRVHRLHSDHSRWWRANKVAVPFAHPFSRRGLNAKRYRRLDLTRTRVPKYGALERLARDARGVSLHSKFPPRVIPWRNFRFPRPRRGGTPKTLRRWTFTTRTGKTGRVTPSRERLIVSRTAREIRTLEKQISISNVWKNHRWGSLDTDGAITSVSGQLFDAIRALPAGVWKTLRQEASSPAAYAATQRSILSTFCRWLRKEQQLHAKPASATAHAAQVFLGNLISLALQAGLQKITPAVDTAQWHSTLRADAFDKRVAIKALRFLHLRTLPRLGAMLDTESILQREHSGLYKRWLQGAAGAAKRTQFGYTPTNRSRYTANVATAFGRRRTRFPGSGRRRKSYDSLLHAFAKKITPARLRRVSTLRFKRVSPRLTGDFREHLLATNVLYGVKRRRSLAQSLSQQAYLSSPWRELAAYRAASSKASQHLQTRTGIKRRFISLPVRTIFEERSARARHAISPYKQQMRVIRSGILRRALRRRRQERLYIDLRHAAIQRRLPREQAARPWKLRRAAKRRHAAKLGPYSHYTVRARAAIAGRWTLVHLSAVGPRREYVELTPLPCTLPSGEHVSRPTNKVCKDKKAFRGFVLPVNAPKRRKLRRQIRDTRKRARRSKRVKRASRLAAVRNTKHWSEKKDRRFRNIAFSHRRGGFAKKVSRALVGKFGARYSSLASTQPGIKRIALNRLAKFALHAQAAAACTTSTAQQSSPSSRGLLAASSLVHQWRGYTIRLNSRIIRYRYRSHALEGLVFSKKRFYDAKFEFRSKRKPSVAEKLIASADAVPLVTPLWFQKPVTCVVKSALAKEKEALAEIAMKEDRFKLTAQYVDSLTAFIPELMNHMLSRKLENGSHPITYKTAQHLIRNIYWSLRVYLNVDPFDTRFFARDGRAAARVHLFESISDLSKDQKTEQPQRAVIRYRFQPGKVVRSANTMRFRGDWLRAFFPAKHALYQENPEDYGNFLFKTRRIRRLRIGPRGMDSWNTMHQLVNHETRARQILNLRFSRTQKRFETILQTTRRTPQRECAPVTLPELSRSPFFTRAYSTYTNRGLVLTARWLHRKKRFIALESGWRTVSPLMLVTARNRALPRIEARGRTNYIATKWSAYSNSLLDPRFARAKSPRSRQYLLRTTKNVLQFNKSERLANLVFYRGLLKKRFTVDVPKKRYWTRLNRRVIAESLRGNLPRTRKSTLHSARTSYRTRRTHVALHTRRAPCIKEVHVTSATVDSRLLAAHQRVKSLGFTNGVALRTSRSILQHRAASRRTTRVTYKKPSILPQYALYARHSFRQMRTTWKARVKAVAHTKLQRTDYWGAIKAKRFTLGAKLSKISISPFGDVRQTLTERRKTPGPTSYFRSRIGRNNLRELDFARGCALYTKFRRQTPFETHRPRLWDRLSQRWMKKFRIGRYWLRDTGRWLRDPWLSEIVACDMSLRPDRLGGELRSQPQKVGEYVADVDAEGRDIRRKDALKERHKFQPEALPVIKDREIKKTNRVLKKGPISDRIVTRHRLGITREARRKPVPTMRLANYEYRDAIREHKENKAKSAKQKEEEEQLRVKKYWARKAKNLAPVRARRLPLKHPANLWLPHVIWKEIQRRIRKFEWRESDEVFFRRGFRTAFQFYPNERRKTPWLEHLMYTRATYSTRLREFRRRQYPHEQKKFKWLQRVRKMLYPGRRARYIKWRRWPQLRRYNQKLHYSLFNLRDRGAARRHFKRLNGRTRPAISAFISMSRGLTDRLDVTCFQMGVAPSIYWARIVTEFGLLRVNGSTIYDPSYRIKPADVIYPNWDTIARFQHYFKPHLKAREEYQRRNRTSTAFYPTNMEYHSGTRAFVYKHAPDESDLRRSSRIRPAYFRWFKLDSV